MFQEDLLIHGDSIYDIVDKQDHPTLHVHLNDKEEPTSPSDSLPKSTKNKKQIFLCRINVSRNARRQMRFGDQKVILVRGHFYSELPLCSRDEPVRNNLPKNNMKNISQQYSRCSWPGAHHSRCPRTGRSWCRAPPTCSPPCTAST